MPHSATHHGQSGSIRFVMKRKRVMSSLPRSEYARSHPLFILPLLRHKRFVIRSRKKGRQKTKRFPHHNYEKEGE